MIPLPPPNKALQASPRHCCACRGSLARCAHSACMSAIVRRPSGDAPCSNSDRPVRTVISLWGRPLLRRVSVVTSAPSAQTARKGFWRMCAPTAVVALRLGRCALARTGKGTISSVRILRARRSVIVRWISQRTRSSPNTFARSHRRADRLYPDV